MKSFEVKVTGFESIMAKNEEEALKKFEILMQKGYSISDLRWKSIEVIENKDSE